jgi:hypothetical protein
VAAQSKEQRSIDAGEKTLMAAALGVEKDAAL